MITELYMENYKLDLTDDISSLLTFSIDDIKDFSTRSTTWSKTIVLPGTKKNNQIFGHIFQVGQSNFYDSSLPNANYNFNASKSAQVILFQDQMQTFKGVLRLMQINLTNGFYGRIEYEATISGNLTGLNVALTSSLLEQLDFSAYDQTYTDNHIISSWDNTGGSGVYFPMIDYGTYSTNKHDWDFHTFRPALYVKEYIDKMFAAAGYRYVSDLLNTPRFKGLIVPHSKKSMTISVSKLITAHDVDTFYGVPPVVNIISNPGEFGALVRFNIITGTGFLANSGPDKTIFTYNGTITTNVVLTFSFTGTFDQIANSWDFLTLYIYKNDPVNVLGSLWTGLAQGSGTGIQFQFGQNVSVNISVAPGDTIQFRVAQAFGSISNVNFITSDFSISSPSGSTIPVPISFGDMITMNSNIPQNIRQVDFLVAIVKMFNLYIWEDKNDPYLIYMQPYVDFYSKNTANSIDWTYKLDRSRPINVKPMSEINAKIYNFKFKSDSDYYNDLYRKRYNEGYGDRIYDSQFDFVQTSQDAEVIFSATPLVGYGGEEKIYPTIFKRTGSDTSPQEENTDCNIRILQTKKITGISPWNIMNGATILNTQTQYGYAGHLNDPDAPNDDLNFGATKELFFILATGNLSNNQFNLYWSSYMAEITDKDSRLVVAYFRLSPKDIFNLDFSKYIYVDGIAFRLNQIKDYNATKPDVCQVELLKINFTTYTESSDTSGPPNGCFLLWSDENTLDWNSGDSVVYSDCSDNSGDGNTTGSGSGSGGSGGGVAPPPTPPTQRYLNWNYTTSGFSTFRIYQNGNLLISQTSNGSDNFPITSGDIIIVQIAGDILHQKKIEVSNTVDGVIYSNISNVLTNSYTFTILSDRDYTVTGQSYIRL